MVTEIPLLEANNVGRRGRKGDAWLFRNSSLTVSNGDRIALTGSTGAGKTVLLRSLAMLDAIDEGTIQWQGTQPTLDRIPAFRSQAIYLPQRASLFAGTVEQNLRLPYSLQINRDHKFSSKWIVTQLSMLNRSEDFLNRECADLSGGERQIVALLRAMQLAPSLLLLDEPTASLDEATSRQIESLVLDWLMQDESYRAYLWVTHDSAQADRIANRKFRIAAGSLSEQAGMP